MESDSPIHSTEEQHEQLHAGEDEVVVAGTDVETGETTEVIVTPTNYVLGWYEKYESHPSDSVLDNLARRKLGIKVAEEARSLSKEELEALPVAVRRTITAHRSLRFRRY